MKTSALFSLFLLFFSPPGVSKFSDPQNVAVLKSNFTKNTTPNPIFYSWEWGGVSRTLSSLGIRFATLHDKDVNLPSLSKFKLLILPDVKNMTEKESQAVRAFVSGGGKVIATGFTSYRNEKDEPAASRQNNFQLADLFGADYLRYDPTPPHGGFLKLNIEKLNIRSEKSRVPLGGYDTIQIRPHSGTSVFATWLDSNGNTPSFPKNLNAAIVENRAGTVIYSSENLFSPENSNNSAVRNLTAQLLNKLLPGTARKSTASLRRFPILPQIGPLQEIQKPTDTRTIRVGLPFPANSGTITSDGPFTIRTGAGDNIMSAPGGWQIAFQGNGNGFSVAGRAAGSFTFVPGDPRYPLKIVVWQDAAPPDSPFKFIAVRGSVTLENMNGKKIIVNELPLEDYLAGVVSHEVPSRFQKEAMKVMAVVARTFALKEIGRKKFQGFDICATVACQAYDGLAHEARSSDEAVMETEGEVVTYNGTLADLPYHATCGGITEDIQNVWNLKPVPYLRSTVDGPDPIPEDLSADPGVKQFLENPPNSYCKESSRFRWQETYSEQDLVSLLKESLPVILKRPATFDRIMSLEVDERTPHGRVASLRIVTDGGTFEIKKDKIRWLFSGGKIGLGGLQSNLFVILPQQDANGDLQSATFLGGGWGHGVGLCQFGAEGMAERGYNFEQILQHYFPGTQVENYELNQKTSP